MLFRRRSEAAISDDAWSQATREQALLRALEPEALRRLRVLAEGFLASKTLSPVGELRLDAMDAATIAALCCLPVLELGLSAYAGWHTVVIYPGGFLARGEVVDDTGIVHEYEEARSGEAWLEGPVVLSLEDVAHSAQLDGYNVVLHEMAHKLDMLDGDANGRPPLHPGMDPVVWYEAFQGAYAELNAQLDRDEVPVIDDYAAESPGEFFAVTSEYYFELPDALRTAYPAVFSQLDAFYRPPSAQGGD